MFGNVIVGILNINVFIVKIFLKYQLNVFIMKYRCYCSLFDYFLKIFLKESKLAILWVLRKALNIRREEVVFSLLGRGRFVYNY